MLLVCVGPAQAQTWPELTGMFDHAAGRTSNGLQWAWMHDFERPNCSRLYLNAGAWFDPTTGWYERYCLEGPWVLMMGWSSWDPFVEQTRYLEARAADGRLGQRYALIAATDTYAVTETITLWKDGVFPIGTFTDSHVWAPVPGGVSHTETFRYHQNIGAGCQFTATRVIKLRDLFTVAHQMFIGWDESVYQPPPVVSVGTWTW